MHRDKMTRHKYAENLVGKFGEVANVRDERTWTVYSSNASRHRSTVVSVTTGHHNHDRLWQKLHVKQSPFPLFTEEQTTPQTITNVRTMLVPAQQVFSQQSRFRKYYQYWHNCVSPEFKRSTEATSWPSNQFSTFATHGRKLQFLPHMYDAVSLPFSLQILLRFILPVSQFYGSGVRLRRTFTQFMHLSCRSSPGREHL